MCADLSTGCEGLKRTSAGAVGGLVGSSADHTRSRAMVMGPRPGRLGRYACEAVSRSRK